MPRYAMGEADALRQFREEAHRTFTRAPRWAEVVAFERAVLFYGLRFWRQAAPRPDAATFSIHRDIGYGATFAVLVGAILVEIVVVHLILLELGWPIAGWIVAALTVYGLFWLAADHQAIRQRPLRLGEDHVDLGCGFRWDVRLAYDDIESVEAGTRTSQDRDRIDLVPFGSPKLIVHLHRPVEVLGVYGLRRPARRLGLVVDDVSTFRSTLNERTGTELSRGRSVATPPGPVAASRERGRPPRSPSRRSP